MTLTYADSEEWDERENEHFGSTIRFEYPAAVLSEPTRLMCARLLRFCPNV